MPCKLKVITRNNVFAIGGQPYDTSLGDMTDDVDCYNYCISGLPGCTAAQTFTNNDGSITCILHTKASDVSNVYRVDRATLYVIERCNDTGEQLEIQRLFDKL